ncbi:hypothetical protein ACH5RR_011956 [Cinchona calisaya]|uniref:Uncharacterized protein n=1 Tax=Cinchona calisaya TaxID=153742 RepID=A0ABD3A6B8_9GENT
MKVVGRLIREWEREVRLAGKWMGNGVGDLVEGMRTDYRWGRRKVIRGERSVLADPEEGERGWRGAPAIMIMGSVKKLKV